MRILCAGATRPTRSHPHFVHRFCRQFIAACILWRQGNERRAARAPAWHPADGHPQAEQAAILAELARFPRYRGGDGRARARKSALAGMLLRQLGEMPSSPHRRGARR
jgi:tRNA(Met) cytidine acetyltransferase